ncbi:sigma-70 family RNA polymerase sigma factor, partial [bacterium 0.1xD8-71]
LGVLADAMDSLLPEERELAMKVFGEEMQVSEFAKEHGQLRTTVSSKKMVVLGKLRAFFRERGLDV